MIAIAARALAGLTVRVPAQDLDYDLSRAPTRPRSGVSLLPGPAQLTTTCDAEPAHVDSRSVQVSGAL
jgi:hypothetical protein